MVADGARVASQAVPLPELDVDHARAHFPALAQPDLAGWAHFENAGGSYACAETIDALHDFYLRTKVQPHHPSPAAEAAGAAMDRAYERWAHALGVGVDEVVLGPSTTANTYVLANAHRALLGPGDEVVVTLQDHEANGGAVRRAAAEAGATLREWRIDPRTGLLDLANLDELVTERTRLVCMPHVSNIVGVENDIASVAGRSRAVGATLLVDGVSAAPHGLPDVEALGCDIYLCSLYKVFSVHQGLMVVRRGLGRELPNQGHFFNDAVVAKRLNPAGPDHAQVAASAGVLDYVDAVAAHHGVAATDVATLWRDHERRLLGPLLDQLHAAANVRLLGPASTTADAHRCPTVAFVPLDRSPADVAAVLRRHRIMAGTGHFYSWRTLDAMGVDTATGVVRVSFVHYSSSDEVAQLQDALGAALQPKPS
jgi:selenocysteine lyase/cysteine desulfurase